MINYEELFSDNIKSMKRSVIRELLKLTQKEGVISFAGGLPSTESFPVEDLKNITQEVYDKYGAKALQYGATEGLPMLLSELIKLMKDNENVSLNEERISITIASQQGLDLVGKIFLNPGDTCIVESPTYLGAVSAFNSYRAKMVDVELDEEGIKTDLLDETIKRLKKENVKPKFIYVIPDFHNPAGVTMSLKRRKELLEIALREKIMVVEDSPYRMIRYRGENLPSLLSLDQNNLVIALFTFSKIFVPGFRLGWAVAPKEIIDKFIVAKQATDLCTPPFNQFIAALFLNKGLLKKTVKRTISIYKEKNELMLESLEKYMPKDKGIRWTKPEGGLFLWVSLPDGYDCDEMFKLAIDKNVAYVVGSAFYAHGQKHNSFRVNFSYPTKEEIVEGVKRLSEVISEYVK
ncbi:MAG: Aminotransferase class I and II [candidate division TA06 bacterium 32_111]|uniref:Aminotransferase class I and II n=2 Tax=Bacteria candidate phyla TaxID=1783234 RepID=A0A117M6E8_UNCT6|nr:MAG: Aminotransferase class I and II [candidate division TA06 bacterium 32_111]KUK86921.1 MAG: Aminotransferase class I and II [candidate division TA06 bacterium 34_109]HAF07244.1 aminotransferase [candidate division WOR-3 bacterium]HCP16642.1 aminotransferase [candidate division WOR-3 bacterium]